MAVALVLTGGLWASPAGQALSENAADQVFFEWVLGYTAHAITHGTNLWFTHLMNAPLGVNVAANTGITVIAVALTPVTLLFGAPVALATALTLNLSLTAYVWYWVFSRHIARVLPGFPGRLIAVSGGAFCGFGPGMVAHANGHLNFTAQFLIPLLLWRLVALTRVAANGPISWRVAARHGSILGLLVALQYGLASELLFFTGVGAVLYAVAWSAQRRHVAGRIAAHLVRPLAIATSVTLALIAYPLWTQFFGPEAYHGTGFGGLDASENLASFGALSARSVGGVLGGWAPMTVNPVEENSYFGPVLLGLVILAAVRLCRRSLHADRRHRFLGLVEARALCATAGVIAILSLGSPLRVGPWRTSVPMPWSLVARLPLFGSALPGRFALLLTPIVALLLVATCVDLVGRFSAGTSARPIRIGRTGAIFAGVVAVLAVMPILPAPIPTVPRAGLPHFITSGDWRDYLPAGSTLLAVPPASAGAPDGQRWQVAAGFDFAIEGGYFLGPAASGRSRLGPVPRSTDALLALVSTTGQIPTITGVDRTTTEADLAYWQTGLIVLPATGTTEAWTPHRDALLSVCTELFGVPRHVDDVWLWAPDRR